MQTPTTATRLSVLLLVAVSSFGCRPAEQITTYEIPKRVDKLRPDRMLGAIAYNDDTAWFFKSTASRKQAEQLEPAVQQLLATVRFDDSGEPQWELPEGWNESDKVVQLRHSTLEAKVGDENVEVTVSKLPWNGDDEQQFELLNVNRWRGQLGERPALLVELLRDADKVALADGSKATFVRLDGKRKDAGRSAGMPAGHPPVASSGGAPPAGPATQPPAASGAGGLEFKAPEGWSPGRAGGMRKAAFNIEADGEQAVVTVIDLPGNSGTLVDNVNRWRGQVKLPPAGPQDIEAAAAKVDIGGVEGRLVELVGPEQTILGVIAPTSEKTWFIKMLGPKQISADEKERFEQFVRSLRLP